MLRNGSRISTIEQVQQQWKLFCEKPPKGFEKYFKQGQKAKETKTEAEAPAKDTKSSQSGRSTSDKSSSNPKKDFAYRFSYDKKIGGGTGDGPLKGNDKWLTLGALATIGLLGASMYMDSGKEITWREFVYG